MTGSELVLVRRDGPVALVTMNRPGARNAMNRAHAEALVEAVTDCQDAVAIVLTGADPAFCAGLDLKELGQAGLRAGTDWIGVVERSAVPVVGAVNGAAVTGGLELALACDFLVGSERARFADTHARVGVVPGGGMSVRLPQRVGIAFARQMSFTGNFVDAATALRVGLLNQVVPHDQLVTFALGLARDIAGTVPGALRTIRDGLARAGAVSPGEGLAIEQEIYRDHARRMRPEDVEARRADVMARGRAQQSPPGGR